MIIDILKRLEESLSSLVRLRAGRPPEFWKGNERLAFDFHELSRTDVRKAIATFMDDAQAAAFRRSNSASLDVRVPNFGALRLEAYVCNDTEEAVLSSTPRCDEWTLFRSHHELLAEAKSAPDDADVYWNLGVAFIEEGEFQLAWHAFEKARVLLPDDGGIHFEIAKLLGRDLFRVDEAITMLERAATLAEPSVEVFVELAVMQRSSKRLEEAERVVRRGLVAFTDHPKLLEALGVILLELQRGIEAVEVLERYVALHGNDDEIQELLVQARAATSVS